MSAIRKAQPRKPLDAANPHSEGTCPVCRKKSYPSKAVARKAARRLNQDLRAYYLHGRWHLTSQQQQR